MRPVLSTQPLSRPRSPSVLFPDGDAAPSTVRAEAAAFADLQLDRIEAALVDGHDEFGLELYFRTPLRSAAAVRYRQEVLRDLEDPQLQRATRRFTDAMVGVRALRRSESGRGPSAYEARVLSTTLTYCTATRQIHADLANCRSAGLGAIRDHLGAYLASDAFARLEADALAANQAMRAVRYRIEIDGARVTLTRPQPGEDYSATVAAAFGHLAEPVAATPAYATYATDDLSEVEAQILEGLARLFPEPFAQRSRFVAAHRDFADAATVRFAREVRFYLAYLDLVLPLRSAGLPFCYPAVADGAGTAVAVSGSFDLAVACKPGSHPGDIVTNDFQLTLPERIIVVTGPNNGGKTTFARTFGQLHHLARLGLSIPARSAQLGLSDRILTHFEREDDIATSHGKLEEELARARAVLECATARSVIVMNESFNSTSLVDARFVGGEILERIRQIGALAVYVTFVDELASASPATVSMVAQVDPADPARRTLKILRQPPTGLAHTQAMVQTYGLSYDQLIERFDR